ncbi:hypothetical protein JYT71_01180 [Acidimicrobiaceae bacterium AH-315-P05]|nr:hypothetical protein [Acidimicrobiaceae bacterium AH-315-P05]
MAENITDGVHRLSRDKWWLSIRGAIDGLSESDVVSYQRESRKLGASSMDGLDEH